MICLQEVNLSFLNLLHQYGAELGGKKHEYYMQVSKMHWYDTVILSKYPCRFYKKLFEQSQMGRCLLTAVITLQGETNQYLGVHCVHLESLNNIPERMRQLKDVNKISSNLDISIVAGDFNFSDGGQ